MYPILLELGPIKIAGYGTMIAIGFILAVFMAEKRAEKKGLNKELIFWLGMTCIISGFIGAKLMFYIVEIEYYMEDLRRLLDFNAGFVVYGGIIVGILAGWLFCKVKQLEFGRYFDIVMPSVALAQAFGRIGCFLAGCCYGKKTNSFIGIAFHDSMFAPNNVKMIPTQLFSSAALFVLVIILVKFADNPHRRPYKVAGLYMILYSIGRFIIEFFRGDERGNVGQLSTSQFISIGIVVAGILVYNMSSILDRFKQEKPAEDRDNNELLNDIFGENKPEDTEITEDRDEA